MNMHNANRTSSITRWLAPLIGLAGMGFTGTALAVPPPPPPPKATATAKAPPPPPAGTTLPAPPPPPSTGAAIPAPPPAPPLGATPPAPTDPSALPPAPLAPPPPPPAPTQAMPQQPPAPSRTANGWGNPNTAPLSWQPADSGPPPLWPARIDYEDGDVVPPGYELKTRPGRGLLGGGLVTFLVPYSMSFLVGGISALDGSNSAQEQFGPLLIPIFGPFVSLGNSEREGEVFAFIMLANGFAQLAGAAMITSAVLMPDKYIERLGALPGKPQVFVGAGSASVRLHF